MTRKLKESHSKQPATLNWEMIASLFVFGVAFLTRLIYLLQVGNTPASALLVGDAVTYDAWAVRIADGDWLGQGVFYQAPLYPYFLGVLYSIFGRDLLIVRLVQITLGAASCVLLMRAGRSFFNRTAVGLAAGLLLAVHPTAIFFDCSIQKSVLDLFFMCALLAVLGELSERSRNRRWLASGIVLGLFILTRENALVLLPILLIWLFVTWNGEHWKIRMVRAGLLLAGLAAVLLPVGFRNLQRGGEFHLTTSQFGTNFYIGNNRAATGTYVSLREGRGHALFEREDATNLAQEAMGRKLTPSEVSSYWTAKTLEEIGADVPRWLRLVVRKWLMVWNISEVGDSDDQYTYGDWSSLLRTLNPLLHFGTLCPLAALGICLTWNRRRQVWLLYALMFVYAASVALFYVFSRYRFPLVPALIVFAAAGLAFLLGAFQEKRWRPLGTGVAIAVVAALLCNRPMMSETLIRADTHNNLGNAFVQEGKLQDAVRHYRHALELDPAYPDVSFNLATVLLHTNRLNGAIRHYEQGLRIDPDYAQGHYNLGIALMRVGQPDRALGHFEQALRIEPAYAEVHVVVGSLLFDKGELAKAKEHWKQALQIKPEMAEAHYNLANAFLRELSFEQAIEHYGQALQIKPEMAEAHYNLGIALEQVGRVQEAVEHYEQAVLLRPDLEELQKRLIVLRDRLPRKAP